MKKTIITRTRPSLDIPWFDAASPENAAIYQRIVSFIQTILTDRYVEPSNIGVITATIELTYTNEEIEYIDTMLLNPFGDYYQDYQSVLNYNDSVGIFADYETIEVL